MTKVQVLWEEFDAARSRLGQVFAEPKGLFDEIEPAAATPDNKVVRLHDAKRKPARKKPRKARKSKSA